MNGFRAKNRVLLTCTFHAETRQLAGASVDGVEYAT